MAKITQFIDPGCEVDHANPPTGHIFVVKWEGGFIVDGKMITGVPYVISYPLLSKTDKHFICDAGAVKKHIDLDQGFEKYADAYAHAIKCTKDVLQEWKSDIQTLEVIIADREAKK